MKKNYERCTTRTKNLLKDSLITLMMKKDFSDISIKEICELSNLNRGTFYLHYKDIYDLLSDIEDQMFQEFDTALNKYSLVDLKDEPLPIFLSAFEFLYNNSAMCSILLGEKEDITFTKKLKSLVKKKCIQDLGALYDIKNEKLLEYYYSFIISGCIGIFIRWVKDDMKESPYKMAMMVEKMVLQGISILEEDI